MSEVKFVNITESAIEMAHLFRRTPRLISKLEFDEGKKLLGTYVNENFQLNSIAIKRSIRTLILQAVEDMATGGEKLLDRQMSLIFYANKFVPYDAQYGSDPVGTVVFSISLKKRAAFKAWRENHESELAQDELNKAVYYLTAVLSEYLSDT